ncbi:DUF3038 domain-containing protein [Crocosphaera sp. XPORK-15E]|uniref:DUF3038 domain-containing protein n=1 Tax=Crocosphaera sp. XPORK-15E TaxID=3110247 RepID=UPI002B21B1FD|nr:DUF3038 domain-containing protein [Crocosphaera sp. XPORK-15E]MEA5537190.1 DUF3038 domain-containing protein [Crocosphaera sp. XPORK-15E]
MVMTSTVNLPSSVPNWENLPLTNTPTPQQLALIQTHIDLMLLALESLIPIDQDMLLQAALDLEINSTLTETVTLWSNRADNGEEILLTTLSVEQTRSLILIICYIAGKYQELIRRAVTLLEQMTAQNKDPAKVTLLGNYLQKFHEFYQIAMIATKLIELPQPKKLASKLLVDLLFYSVENGHRRLWLALLDYTH